MLQCPACGSYDAVVDESRGATVCGNCGEILEQQRMIDDDIFQGQVKSAGPSLFSGRQVKWPIEGAGNSSGFGNSHEISISKGIQKITMIADRLQLNSRIQMAGTRMFRLAQQMGFNHGRPTKHIACACLYVSCRQNRSPHLLLDFSDVMQIPVKDICMVYVKLMRRLVGGCSQEGFIDVPMIDPSLFLERFARKLELGTSQHQVQTTANRLIQFMSRDWLCIGRRPYSLCGAALAVSAFYHGFRIPAQHISEVVRIGEGTIKTRLLEMRHTPLALMNREEFEQEDVKKITDGDQKALPPCMKRAGIFGRRAAALTDAEKEALKDKARDPAIMDGQVSDEPSRGVANTHAIVPIVGSREEKYTTKDPSPEVIEDIVQDIQSQLISDGVLAKTPQESAASQSSGLCPAAIARIDQLMDKKPIFADCSASEPGDGQGTSIADVSASSVCGGGDDTLSDVDDDDLDMYLLDEEERQSKSDIWHEVNKDYLEEWYIRGQEAKRKKERQESSQCGDTASVSSKRSKRSSQSAGSCKESIMMALVKKGKVGQNRINMDALDALLS